MEKIINGICFVLFVAFAFGWLRFYEGQPTWWNLIVWLGN